MKSDTLGRIGKGMVGVAKGGFWLSVGLLAYGYLTGSIPYVRGRSMEPAIHHGDYCLLDIYPHVEGRVAEGDIVTFEHPDSFFCYVKRIDDIAEESGDKRYWMLGDNREESADSREFGWIDKIDSRVVRVYCPHEGLFGSLKSSPPYEPGPAMPLQEEAGGADTMAGSSPQAILGGGYHHAQWKNLSAGEREAGQEAVEKLSDNLPARNGN